MAILAAGGYLRALNTENLFKVSGDHPPPFLPGLLVTVILLVSGLLYYWWEQSVRRKGSAGQQAIFILSGLLMIVAFAGAIWIGRMMILVDGSPPFDAYLSLMFLLTWFSAFHFALTAIIGLLLLGRVMRSRVNGHDYIVEVVGYWWYYTAIAGLLMWLFILFLSA